MSTKKAKKEATKKAPKKAKKAPMITEEERQTLRDNNFTDAIIDASPQHVISTMLSICNDRERLQTENRKLEKDVLRAHSSRSTSKGIKKPSREVLIARVMAKAHADTGTILSVDDVANKLISMYEKTPLIFNLTGGKPSNEGRDGYKTETLLDNDGLPKTVTYKATDYIKGRLSYDTVRDWRNRYSTLLASQDAYKVYKAEQESNQA